VILSFFGYHAISESFQKVYCRAEGASDVHSEGSLPGGDRKEADVLQLMGRVARG